MNDISSGKLRGIMKLADAKGLFKMMAIDQRGSMVQALADALNKDNAEVQYEDVATLKPLLLESFPQFNSILTDPIYGHPYSIAEIPRDVALLLAMKNRDMSAKGLLRTNVSPTDCKLEYRQGTARRGRCH